MSESKAEPQAAGEFVIIEPLNEEERQTESGIFLADDEEETFEKGVVVSMGPGILQHGQHVRPAPGVHVGDVVIYNKASLDKLPVPNQHLGIMRQGAICSRYEEE